MLNIKIFLIIGFSILLLFITGKLIHYFSTDIIEIKVSQTIHVRLENKNNHKDQYCLYTYNNKGCFYIGEDVFRGIFNPEALYSEFKEDSTYIVKVHGLNMPFLGLPYIIKKIK